MLRRWTFSVSVAGVLCGALGGFAAEVVAPLPGLAQEGDDPPALHTPAKERGEIDQDRIAASAIFAHGRLLYQREDLVGALRRYERAYRYDPEATVVLDAIVPLAFELEHNEEAARYAVIAAEKNPQDPLLLRRLAMHLTEQQEYARALKLYQKSFDLQQDANDVTSILLHMEIGRLNFLEGNYGPAAESFARVRDAIVDPKKFELTAEMQKIVLGNAPTTYTLLGESFFQADKLDDAEAMFRKANEAKPDAPRLAFLLARIRAKQKRFDDALSELDLYFKTKTTGSGAEPYLLVGEIFAAKLSDQKAAREATLSKLKSLYSEAGDNRSLAYVYGRELHLAGQNKESLAVLQKAAEGELTSEVAEELTSIYQSQKDVANLLDLLGKSVGKTASLATLGEAGAALAKDKELVAKLIAAARETRKSQPDKLTSGTALAIALLAMQIQEFDAADEFYAVVVDQPEKVARTKSPKAEAILAWGLEMLQAEQPERAARVFQRAIDKKLLPEREELLYYFLSGALEMQDKTTEALAALDAGMAKGKPSLRLLSRRAWIQYHAKRYADAEKSYLELLAKYNADHKSADVRDSLRESRLVLSNICVQTKRVDEGIEWLEQVLDEFPEDVGAHNDLGYLFAEQGKHLLRALRMTQFAVAAEPENSAYRDSLGWAYYQLGRYPEAVKELEKALSLREPDGVILDHLADAYAKNQQRDKALATYELAVAAFQKDKDQDAELLKKTQAKLAALRKS